MRWDRLPEKRAGLWSLGVIYPPPGFRRYLVRRMWWGLRALRARVGPLWDDWE